MYRVIIKHFPLALLFSAAWLGGVQCNGRPRSRTQRRRHFVLSHPPPLSSRSHASSASRSRSPRAGRVAAETAGRVTAPPSNAARRHAGNGAHSISPVETEELKEAEANAADRGAPRAQLRRRVRHRQGPLRPTPRRTSAWRKPISSVSRTARRASSQAEHDQRKAAIARRASSMRLPRTSAVSSIRTGAPRASRSPKPCPTPLFARRLPASSAMDGVEGRLRHKRDEGRRGHASRPSRAVDGPWQFVSEVGVGR